MTTEEGCRLIDKFMEYLPLANEGYRSYDVSMDWLIEVVDKIEAMPDVFGRKGFYGVRTSRWLGYRSCHIEFHFNEYGSRHVTEPIANSYTTKSYIENMWLAVVQFIQWYNKQTNTKST